MLFSEWLAKHNKDKQKILDKLKGQTYEEIINYFDYDNMRVKEPSFCPLYKLGTKCHKVEKLNCLLCACPYFQYSDTTPVYVDRDKNILHMSRCSINSKFAKEFIHTDEEGTTISNCDCSECILPHTTEFVSKYIKKKLYYKPMEDSCSLLEMIRAEQLFNILGKNKLF